LREPFSCWNSLTEVRLAARGLVEFSGHLFDPTIRLGLAGFCTPARQCLSPHSSKACCAADAFRYSRDWLGAGARSRIRFRSLTQKLRSPNLLCMPQPLAVFRPPARGRFSCDSVPECSTFQHKELNHGKESQEGKKESEEEKVILSFGISGRHTFRCDVQGGWTYPAAFFEPLPIGSS
jgi:hypothetical protein